MHRLRRVRRSHPTLPCSRSAHRYWSVTQHDHESRPGRWHCEFRDRVRPVKRRCGTPLHFVPRSPSATLDRTGATNFFPAFPCAASKICGYEGPRAVCQNPALTSGTLRNCGRSYRSKSCQMRLAVKRFVGFKSHRLHPISRRDCDAMGPGVGGSAVQAWISLGREHRPSPAVGRSRTSLSWPSALKA